MLCNEGIDSLLVEGGEYLDVTLCIIVRNVEPELIELIWRGAGWVEPDVTALGLAEFLAVSLGDKRTGEGVCLIVVAKGTTDKLRTGCHITPLVITAELHLTVLGLIEMEEVVTLEQLVCKLSE